MADLSNLSAPSLVPGQLVSVRGPGGVAGLALPTGEGGKLVRPGELIGSCASVRIWSLWGWPSHFEEDLWPSGPLCALDYMYDVGLICIRKRTPVRGSARVDWSLSH